MPKEIRMDEPLSAKKSRNQHFKLFLKAQRCVVAATFSLKYKECALLIHPGLHILACDY